MSFLNALKSAPRKDSQTPPPNRIEKFLFIICMNNSGSTLLEHILNKCRNAVGLPPPGGPDHQVNGQRFVKEYMPTPDRLKCRRTWSEQGAILQDELRYQWSTINQVWHEHWARNPKFQTANPRVLLEKSPPNVFRAAMLQKHFKNSFFILMQRNPYAVAEGIRRRADMPIARCTQHWIRCAQQQIRNEKVLRRAISLNYEDLSERPDTCRKRVIDLIPELDDVDIRQEVAVHSLDGHVRQPIVNYNDKQIALLSQTDLAAINHHLDQVPEVMAHFGYQRIRHDSSEQTPLVRPK